jgi:glycosyltransferase involved in cell wall biosynthesis
MNASSSALLQKVLLVTPNLHFPFGGPPVTILKMAYAYRTNGFDVVVAYGRTQDRTEADPRICTLLDMGVTFRSFPVIGNNRTAQKWGISPSLIRFVWASSVEFDIISVHQVWGLPFFIQLSRSVAEKVVRIPHESLTIFDVSRTRGTLTLILKHTQLFWDRRRKSRIVFSSHLEREASLGVGKETTTAVAYHPSGPPVVFANRSYQCSQTLRVGYIGRLHKKKNVQQLIEALEDLPNVKLFIAGSGDLEPELRQLSHANGTFNRVHWLGFVSGDEKEAFYNSIDLCAVPSTFECFGQSAAEAMERALPLLCSKQIGAAEMLEDNISCIRCTTDALSIKSALMRFSALSSSERQAMALAAQSAARCNFSNKTFVLTVQSLGRAHTPTFP